MIELWISFAIAILLFAMVVAWLFRAFQSPEAPPPGPYSPQVLIQLNLALPSPDVVQRIFATEDSEYISREGSRRLEALFLAERKRLALAWLRRTREVLRRLMSLHLKVVRQSAGSSLATEIRLSFNYSFFVLTYGFLMILIFVRGPFWARSVIGLASRVADRAGSSSARLLGSLDPIYLGKMKES
jgi:hypothetical protein